MPDSRNSFSSVNRAMFFLSMPFYALLCQNGLYRIHSKSFLLLVLCHSGAARQLKNKLTIFTVNAQY